MKRATIPNIPPRPATIAAAEERLRTASETRHSGQVRHVEATNQLRNQPAGLPPTITQAEVDTIGIGLRELFDEEAAAKAALEAEIAAHQASVTGLLSGPLDDMKARLQSLLDEVMEDLAAAQKLQREAVESRVTLPSRLPVEAANMRHSVQSALHKLASIR